METFFVNAEIILNFLIVNSLYSALLALVVLTSKLVFPGMPRAIEYGLWCLVLIRLILPTDFSISYSLGYLTHDWIEAEIPAVLSGTVWLSKLANQSIFVDYTNSFTWLKLLSLVWLAISMIVASKFIALRIKLARLMAVAHPVEDYWIVKAINEWRREFNIRRQIIVIGSDDFLSPFTFALLSPVVFIPQQLLEKKNEKIFGPIIAHELAHIKRLDALWLIFQNMIQIIFCLNPVVWLAVRRLNSLREEMCDQKVLDTKNISNDEYGKSLLQVLRLNTAGFHVGRRSPEHFATFFLSHKNVFKRRIAAIGSNRALKPKIVFQYAAVGLFGLFFLPLSWQQSKGLQPAKPFVEPSEKMESPFPDEIRKNYQPPVLPNPQNNNSSYIKWK